MDDNNSIAKFMGASVEELPNGKYRVGYLNSKGEVFFHNDITIKSVAERVAYHGNWYCDWDWLMSVVEKIETLDMVPFFLIQNKTAVIAISESQGVITHKIESSELVEEDGKIFTKQKDSKLEAVYNCVVKFIKWYNDTR